MCSSLKFKNINIVDMGSTVDATCKAESVNIEGHSSVSQYSCNLKHLIFTNVKLIYNNEFPMSFKSLSIVKCSLNSFFINLITKEINSDNIEFGQIRQFVFKNRLEGKKCVTYVKALASLRRELTRTEILDYYIEA